VWRLLTIREEPEERELTQEDLAYAAGLTASAGAVSAQANLFDLVLTTATHEPTLGQRALIEADQPFVAALLQLGPNVLVDRDPTRQVRAGPG